MKRNISFYYLASLLALLALTGVKYVEPTLHGDITPYTVDWNILQEQMEKDMGVELGFPLISLAFFALCTIIATATDRLRNIVFILALINVLYTVAIFFYFRKYIGITWYTMENGYYLHLASSIGLQILAITSLKSVKRKPRSSAKLDLLDDAF